MKAHGILRTALTAALSAVLLLPAAGAAATGTAAEEAPSYTLTQRGEPFPLRAWGQVVELGEASLTLENSDSSDAYQKLVVNVGEDTRILDAVTGEARSFADIRQGETVYVWAGPEMTKSLPPITTARLLLCGLPDGGIAPTYAEVQRVTRTEEGLEVYVTGEVVLRLNSETQLLAPPGGGEVSLEDIVPGTRLLSWYNITTMSLPAQAAPTQVMVFPTAYSGWVSAQGLAVSLNGQALDLTGAQAPRVEEGRLLVPVRAMAEALGCTVTWEPYTGQVVVSRADTECYRFTIGQSQAALGDVTVGLVLPTRAEEGATFLALDDLIVLPGLQLETGF